MQRCSPLLTTSLACCVLAAVGCGASQSGNHDIPPPPEFLDGKFVFDEDSQIGPQDENQKKRFDWTQPIEFEPPNTNRANPFIAGVDGQGVASTSEESAEDESQTKVSIKGFVNVDKPRVFLRIGGELRSLSEGESLNEVQVVKIQPPHVTLVRDGVTETRSLLNEPTDQRNEPDQFEDLDDLDDSDWLDEGPELDITS